MQIFMFQEVKIYLLSEFTSSALFLCYVVCVCAFSLFVPSIWFLLVSRGERDCLFKRTGESNK